MKTVSEMIEAVAEAMSAGDIEILERAGAILDEWMISSEERSALCSLINAAESLIEKAEG